MKQATATPKRLDMSEIVSGWGESILDLNHSTPFTVVLDTGAKTKGHSKWINANLHRWEKLLNTTSGAQVISVQTKDKKENFWEYTIKRERIMGTKIVVRLNTKGTIKFDAIADPDIRKMLRGQLKKILACKIIRNFLPPFDIQNPLFSHTCIDSYQIDSHQIVRRDEVLPYITSQKAIKDLFDELPSRDLVSKINIDVDLIKNPLYININWACDVSDENRSEVFNVVRNFVLKNRSY